MPSANQTREEEWCAINGRLGALLAAYGGNARHGGDFFLVEQDTGTYEQKVLVFHKDALKLDLIEAALGMLKDYSPNWRLLFVATSKDGAEMLPPKGLKISGDYGVEPFDRIEISPEEDRETRALYDTLEKFLAGRGTSNAFGEGDYWIVDDKWVARSHLVCIFKIEFLTPSLVGDLQHLLMEAFAKCVVCFQIEVKVPGIEIPLPGIRVFPNRIEQDWDRDKLRSIFGEKFLW